MTTGERIREARERAGKTQQEVADHFGISRPAVSQWEKDETAPANKKLSDLAALLRVDLQWLMSDRQETNNLSQNKSFDSDQANALESSQSPLNLPSLEGLPRDVPVLGTARGGLKGAFELNTGDPIAHVMRRPGIAGSPKAYAIYVEGDSMEPRYFAGELIHVDPSRKVRPGDFVLIEQVVDEHDVPQAFIKRLVRRTATKVIVEQYNPPKTIDMPENTIKTMHRVLLSNEVDGV